jgi:putative effector of murein hydrolase
MPISPFAITILSDAQSTLYSYVVSINYAKFHSPKTKPLLVTINFISFLLFYVKIDQKMLVMN